MKTSFARLFVLPALWVLLVPCAGLAFTSFYLASWSSEARADLAAAAIGLCGPFGFLAEPEGVNGDFCLDLLQFVWIRNISAALLVAAALSVVVVWFSLRWVARAPKDQHKGFRLGWTTLRLFGVPHVLGQGLTLTFLSFWLTALWFGFYSVKLVGIAALLAAVAAVLAIVALFARSHVVPMEHGALLRREDAPSFFSNMDTLAKAIGTAPPRNVVVGIDDNFFVTEMPFDIFDRYPTKDDPRQRTDRVEGRTLYASLSLMRALQREETNAILAHELAHFSSGDTLQSQKLAPLLREFGAYMTRLESSLTFGVASCLVAFRALFERISQGHSRAAEFAADAVAARVVGGQHAARALLKVAAYSTYRSKTEGELIDAMSQNHDLKIAQRVQQGFSAFIDEPTARAGLLDGHVPHPFDSHPPLRERLTQFDVVNDVLFAESPAHWCEDIATAEAIELRLWTAYEEKFQENHDFLIALRLVPKTPEEVAHVEKHFPPLTFTTKKGASVTLTFRGLTLEDGVSLTYETVRDVTQKDVTFKGNCLVLKTHAGPEHKLVLGHFKDDGAAVMNAFGAFWQRHHVSAAEADRALTAP